MASDALTAPDTFHPEFIAIPYSVFTDASISPSARLVYGRLRLYAGKDGRCYPKHETLAREVCLSDRQLRTVLSELKEAGWIDWGRTRTSCVYTVNPDRKKTSVLPLQTGGKLPLLDGEIGRKLPARPEENCQSRSEENFRQKRSIEKKLEEREENPCSSPESSDERASAVPPCENEPQPTTLFPVEPRTNAAKKGPDGLTAQQETWFSEWWDLYWRKKARLDARKSFGKHVKTAARFAEVMAATEAQRPEMLTREPGNQPHGATWLNGERWNDPVEGAGPVDAAQRKQEAFDRSWDLREVADGGR